MLESHQKVTKCLDFCRRLPAKTRRSCLQVWIFTPVWFVQNVDRLVLLEIWSYCTVLTHCVFSRWMGSSFPLFMALAWSRVLHPQHLDLKGPQSASISRRKKAVPSEITTSLRTKRPAGLSGWLPTHGLIPWRWVQGWFWKCFSQRRVMEDRTWKFLWNVKIWWFAGNLMLEHFSLSSTAHCCDFFCIRCLWNCEPFWYSQLDSQGWGKQTQNEPQNWSFFQHLPFRYSSYCSLSKSSAFSVEKGWIYLTCAVWRMRLFFLPVRPGKKFP